MDAGSQPLLAGNADEQLPKLGVLVGRQRRADVLLVRGGDPRDFSQLGAGCGMQRVQPAIITVASPLHEPLAFEVVDQRDDAAGMDSYPLRDRLLAQSGCGRDHPQQPNVRRAQVNGLEPFGDALRGVRTKLSEQEGHAQVLARSAGGLIGVNPVSHVPKA